jgi:hypothetical protein
VMQRRRILGLGRRESTRSVELKIGVGLWDWGIGIRKGGYCSFGVWWVGIPMLLYL